MRKSIFKVGFSRKDITPDVLPVFLNTGIPLTEVGEKIYTTCVALNDGESTALILSVDAKAIIRQHDEGVKKAINERTGVPIENIMINCLHNHSSLCPGVPESESVMRWTNERYYPSCIESAVGAIEDLCDSEVYYGTGKTTNFAFVRRYIHEDGTFSSINMRKKSSTPIVAHESEADDTVQFIRFVREGKKDVLIANWQAHAAHAAIRAGVILGDYIYHFRNGIEASDEGLLFSYYCGASGNINLTVKIPERNVCDADYIKVGKKLSEVVLAGLGDAKKIETGKIKSALEYHKFRYRTIPAERFEKAQEIVQYQNDKEKYNALMDENGFMSALDVHYTISVGRKGGVEIEMPFGVIACGELAFVSVPYEMFDTNGMAIKESSPYKTTFILTLTGDCAGYVPSALAVKNGGFECYMTLFEYGTAEFGEQILKNMINNIYEKD